MQGPRLQSLLKCTYCEGTFSYNVERLFGLVHFEFGIDVFGNVTPSSGSLGLTSPLGGGADAGAGDDDDIVELF